jgi:hypothetical protein
VINRWPGRSIWDLLHGEVVAFELKDLLPVL